MSGRKLLDPTTYTGSSRTRYSRQVLLKLEFSRQIFHWLMTNYILTQHFPNTSQSFTVVVSLLGEMSWNAQSQPNLRYCPTICLGGGAVNVEGEFVPVRAMKAQRYS